MNQVLYPLIVSNAFRFVGVLVYVSIAIAALARRAQLGTATAPAAIGSSSLAVANSLSLAMYFWQVTTAMHGREAIQHIAMAIALMNYVTQSLGVIGAASLGLAVFSGRHQVRATPNLRWSGP